MSLRAYEEVDLEAFDRHTSRLIHFLRIVVFLSVGTYLGLLWASMYFSAHILGWVGIHQ